MDSSNITEKLNIFTSLVLKDASAKREKLMEDVEKEYAERIGEKETELLQEAYDTIQHTIQDARKYANERVLHAEIDSKKKLILKREEIIEEVMSDAKREIVRFTESEKYGEWLLDKIEKALFEVGKGAKTIYISSDDIRFKEKIEQIPDMSGINVEASPEHDFLGGAKVLNTDRKVAVDYSLKEMLALQKQAFLQNSGLTLS
ncbi:MAG: V-type ATP synthase subunit E [Oscillospiraceae bacterium]|nr:V-type ATP synthase subunit E [Oscillospiraceae bacterium]